MCGNKQDQTVTLTLALASTDFDRDFNFHIGTGAGAQNAIDVEGNSYHTNDVQGSDSKYTNFLYVGAPVKVTVKFNNIPPSVLYMKRVTLAFNYTDRNDRLQSAKPFFTDLKVDWQ